MGCVQSKNSGAKESSAPVYKATNTANSKHRSPTAVNGDSRGSVGVAVSDHSRKVDAAASDVAGAQPPTSQQSASKRDKSQSASKQRKKAPFVKDKFDPRVLQKYEVKALIGRGSFSKVIICFFIQNTSEPVP